MQFQIFCPFGLETDVVCRWFVVKLPWHLCSFLRFHITLSGKVQGQALKIVLTWRGLQLSLTYFPAELSSSQTKWLPLKNLVFVRRMSLKKMKNNVKFNYDHIAIINRMDQYNIINYNLSTHPPIFEVHPGSTAFYNISSPTSHFSTGVPSTYHGC